MVHRFSFPFIASGTHRDMNLSCNAGGMFRSVLLWHQSMFGVRVTVGGKLLDSSPDFFIQCGLTLGLQYGYIAVTLRLQNGYIAVTVRVIVVIRRLQYRYSAVIIRLQHGYNTVIVRL